MKNKRLLFSIIISLITVLPPLSGLPFPMESGGHLSRGYPFAFLTLTDPFNVFTLGFNLLNFAASVFVFYWVLTLGHFIALRVRNNIVNHVR